MRPRAKSLLRRVAGRNCAATWTAVHFEHNRIKRPVPTGLRRFGRILLIRVVIHWTSAAWAIHLLFHSSSQSIVMLSRPCRKVLDIHMSSAKNLSIRRK
jgi:hypothetical protein